MFNCYPTFIGQITTNIVQNPSAKIVELDCMPVVTHKAEELDIGVFNGKPYIYHDQVWFPIEEILELEDSNMIEKQKIFIINGAAGSGKTTFEEFCHSALDSMKEEYLILDSIINPVKRVAFDKGWWDGKEKTPKVRKFLSDLKDILTDYDNIPMKMLMRGIENAIILYNAPAVFIDMREAADIEKFKELYSDIYDIKTVLVRRPGDIENAAAASNHADADVFDYCYDITVFNYGDIDELEETAELFVKTFILDQPLPEEYCQRFDYV